jgi:hypothetical protein
MHPTNQTTDMTTRIGRFPLIAKMVALSAAALSLISCSELPLIKPVPADIAGKQIKQCLRPFPTEKIRLIHAIEASMEGGTQTTQLGVLLVNPESKALHSVLMTLEGIVLFDAEDNGRININRAVPPFDTMIFAEKLMSDIRLIFLRPAGPILATGFVPDGTHICRFRTEQGMTLDIVLAGKNKQEMRLYTEQNELVRKVTAYRLDEKDIPDKILLEAYGFREYSLQMRLIAAEPVTDENNNPKSKDNRP